MFGNPKWPDQMLKKTDLAKQFELLTQQEIKNYQDSLNFVLQSIKDLKEEIEHLRQESLENHAAIHSVQCGMAIEIDHNREQINNFRLRHDGYYHEQRAENEKNALDSIEIMQTLRVFQTLAQQFKDNFVSISHKIEHLKNDHSQTKERLSDSVDDLLRRFSSDLDKTKQEILDAPTEASIVRDQLEQKIDSHKVDVAGIMKELTIFKKENFVIEKKLENIYTLIERLQKKDIT